MPHIKIWDSLAGSDKTTRAIKKIKQNPEQNRIVLVKYLDEAERIIKECPRAEFYHPDASKYGASRLISISILEGAMWFQEDRIQRDYQEPEPGIYAAGQLQPIRLCWSRTEFVSHDRIGVSKCRKNTEWGAK